MPSIRGVCQEVNVVEVASILPVHRIAQGCGGIRCSRGSLETVRLMNRCGGAYFRIAAVCKEQGHRGSSTFFSMNAISRLEALYKSQDDQAWPGFVMMETLQLPKSFCCTSKIRHRQGLVTVSLSYTITSHHICPLVYETAGSTP